MKYFYRCLFVLLLTSGSFLYSADNFFGKQYTAVIDVNQKSGNVLFRGDFFLDKSGELPILKLRDAMKASYNKYRKSNKNIKMKWPKQYNLVVIGNLTWDTLSERKVIIKSNKYFGGDENSIPMKVSISNSQGVWYWWQVNPYLDFDPPIGQNVSWETLNGLLGDLSKEEIDEMLLEQSWDGRKLEFVQLIELMKRLIDTRKSKPTMIYVHSRRGFNRSTAVNCAYRMRYFSEDIETAFNNSLIPLKGIHEPQGLKGFLYLYKRYLELYSP